MRDQPLALYKKPYNKKSMAFHSQEQDHASSTMILTLLFLLSLQATMPYAANNPQDALLMLKQSLSNAPALASWDPLTAPCTAGRPNWVGIECSRGGNVYGLKLENMGLSGMIDMDALSGLRQLRSISFMNNQLGGPIPNMKSLKALKSIYLSNNLFEGVIDPDAFSGMNRLKKLLLSNNKFTGPIPISLTKVPKLIELRIEGNQFQGPIPDFALTSFHDLSVANNQLEGPIPMSLSGMSPNTFTGNKGLCGAPLEPCNKATTKPEEHLTPSPQAAPPSKNDKYSTSTFPIVVPIATVLLVILLLIAVVCKRRSSKEELQIQSQLVELPPKNVVAATRDAGNDEGSCRGTAATRAKADTSKLCFLREDGDRFDLPDLLKASAEILGGGCFGSSYKAILLNGTLMVVKRFKEMNNVGREEFQEHMRRIGRIEHKNVVPLVAYYYRKEEKLLVSKFVKKGSLAMHLHGNHSRGQSALDWTTRLHIIKGVSRGLSCIYRELSILITPHGHLKSSNVLLDESFNPLIHDYGLVPLINQESAHELMVAYKSPEFVTKGRINKKTDVFSLGILIIEVMTGQLPAGYLQQGSKVHLSGWAKEVIGEARGTQVFDKNIGSTTSCEGEMQKMLEIGLTCCEEDVGKRWDIKEACEKIEEVKERDNDDDDFYSAYSTSEGDRRSLRGMSDDFTITIT